MKERLLRAFDRALIFLGGLAYALGERFSCLHSKHNLGRVLNVRLNPRRTRDAPQIAEPQKGATSARASSCLQKDFFSLFSTRGGDLSSLIFAFFRMN